MPNTKGPKFAWLDPTSIYIRAVTIQDLLGDLSADLNAGAFDVVCGCDAMGFVLGEGLSARAGFMPVRHMMPSSEILPRKGLLCPRF